MSTLPNTIEGRSENLRANLPADSPTADPGRRSLESRMRRLRGQVVRLLWLRSLSVALIGVILVTLAAAALDWWWRPSSAIGRWGMSGMVVAALAGVACWCIRHTPWRGVSLLAVARRLERQIPSLDDRLSSAVAILQSGDRQSGASGGRSMPATDLTDRAVRQAAVDLEEAQPERAIARGPAWRMAILATMCLAAVVAACWWRPSVASLAAHRLFAPAGQAAWPQRHHLQLLNVPPRMHAGTDLEVFVHDQRGELPADTEVLIRDEQGDVESALLRLSGKAAMATIERVSGDFAIRARGGDDNTMPWRIVRVVTPPALDRYHVRLLPPAYSGRQARTLVGERFRVLAGTQIWIEAIIAPPITDAQFVRIDRGAPPVVPASSGTDTPADEASAADLPTSWPVAVGDGGRSLAVGPITLDRDGHFAFRWVDSEGLAGESREQWRIEVDQDAVPRVAITEPAADLEITPSGSIDLAFTADDDLGLAGSWFELRTSADPSQPIRLEVERYEDNRREATQRIRWAIAELPSSAEIGNAPEWSVGPGETIEVIGVALDRGGGRGESTTRRLRIVSPEKLQQNLARNQRAAMEQLREAAREQAIAAEQAEAARGRLSGDAEQAAAAADRLRAADSAQSTVQRRIDEGPQSALEQLRSALRNARDNQLDAATLEQLLGQVEAIADEHVRPAGDQLDRTRDALSAGDAAAAEEAIDEAIAAQRQAAERLGEVVDTLQRQDARRAAIDQLTELAAAQSRLGEESRDIADASDPASEASRLAQRQRALARNAETLAQRLQQLADEMQQQDAAVAAAAERALETLEQGPAEDPTRRRGAAADAMRAAANELERGREGRAAEMQSDVVEQLSTARRQLSGEAPDAEETGNDEPAKRFAGRVQQLHTDQQSLVESLRQEIAPELARVQNELADRAEQVAADATAPPGFPAAVEDAAAEMRTAAALLRRRGTEAAAVDQAEAAIQRLAFIAASLQETSGDASSEGESPAAEDQSQQAEQPEQPQAVPLATLRLVRATQDFLRRRTEQLAAAQQAGEAADPLRRARAEAAKRALADEQARLVERIEQYAREMAAARANPPENSDAPQE